MKTSIKLIPILILVMSTVVISCKDESKQSQTEQPPTEQGVESEGVVQETEGDSTQAESLFLKTITLEVDTDNIQNGMVKEALDPYCNFGQDGDTLNKNYRFTINLGDRIEWVGKAKNNTDIVNIELIQHQGGPNVFPGNKTNLPGSGNNGRKVAVTPVGKTDPGPDCQYFLIFSIDRDGKSLPGIWKIDPFFKVQ